MFALTSVPKAIKSCFTNLQFNILVLLLFYDAASISSFIMRMDKPQTVNFIHSLLVYGRHLPKPDPKPGFGGFPNPKPGFGKKAPGLESLMATTAVSLVI